MPLITTQEYRDQYENTKYPFADNATLTDTENKLTIPNSIFLDASLFIPGAIAPLYLSKVIIRNRQVVITVSDSSKHKTASGMIDTGSDTITLTDSKHRTVGLLISDSQRLGFFNSVPDGTYSFSAKATWFSPRCVVTLPSVGVTTVGCEGNNIYGDIRFIGRNGIILTADTDNNTIRFDIVGEPLFKRLKYTNPSDFNTPNYVLTVNGVEPDEYGNINITSFANADTEDIIRINTTPDGITIFAAGAP